MNANIICVVRKPDAIVYLGRTERDAHLLQFYTGSPFIYLAGYAHVLQLLGQYGVSLLVEEPEEAEEEHRTNPATMPGGDLWF